MCMFVFTQDYCGSAQSNGTFRVITENVPCGTTGTTCSKTIKIFLGVHRLYQYLDKKRIKRYSNSSFSVLLTTLVYMDKASAMKVATFYKNWFTHKGNMVQRCCTFLQNVI